MNNIFSIKEAFSFAWKTFVSRPWFFVAVVIISMVVLAVTSIDFDAMAGDSWIAWIVVLVFTLLSIVISIYLDMGLVALALAAHDDVQTARLNTLWSLENKPFWKYAGANILVSIIVIIGFILLIVPGVIAMLGLMFTKYLVVDRKLGPVEALKESWRITKGHRLKLLGFVVLIMVLNIAGAVALLVGLLVTIPLTMLVMAHVYRTLEHQAHEVVSPGAV